MSWTDGVPWAIAVVGWACTHLFSEARERRKEMRSQIDKLHEQIVKLEQDARSFHCEKEFSSIKTGDIISKVALMERMTNRIPILSIDNLNPHIVGFRRAITLKNFDKSTFATQSVDSELLHSICKAAQDIEDEIERQYRYRYPPDFPYIRFRK